MKKTIMIVDDDPDDVQLFCEAVAEIDPLYNCLVAYNGEEALKLLQNTNTTPDFIFLDLNMPRMNGKQCLAQFKKISLKLHLFVLFRHTNILLSFYGFFMGV